MLYLGPNNPNGQAVMANSTPVVVSSNQSSIPIGIQGGVKATYRAAVAAAFAAAAGTGLFFVITGSATKTVRIQKIVFSGPITATLQYIVVNAAKYSTAPTVGTIVTLTKVPLDSTSAASTLSLCQVYTAAPTAGTKVGDIATRRVIAQSTTVNAAGLTEDIVFDFESNGESSTPILRGIAECLGLYFQAAPSASITGIIEVEWTEE